MYLVPSMHNSYFKKQFSTVMWQMQIPLFLCFHYGYWSSNVIMLRAVGREGKKVHGPARKSGAWVIFLLLWQNSWQEQFKSEFIWVCSLSVWSITAWKSPRQKWDSWSHCTCRQEAETKGCWCSVCLLVFHWGTHPIDGAAYVHVLSSLLKPFWKHTHRHMQRCVSMVIL